MRRGGQREVRNLDDSRRRACWRLLQLREMVPVCRRSLFPAELVGALELVAEPGRAQVIAQVGEALFEGEQSARKNSTARDLPPCDEKQGEEHDIG